MRAALIQMNSRDDKSENIREASRLIEAAVAAERPDLVLLPELFTYLGGTIETRRANAEQIPGGPAYDAMAELAAKHGIVLHAGSMLEAAGDKVHNTTVVFDRAGRELAVYRKIHLFDVVTPDGTAYLESDTVRRGGEAVTYEVDGVTVGCTVCYDLRFPELYRRLRDAGADIIAVPAAFTLQTGRDHWEVLLRARAIETQTYVLAAGQIFGHDGGRKQCYGHSMVVNPWGHVIAQAPDTVGHVAAALDLGYLRRVRESMPVHEHHVLA